jgi:hypothetical protein
MTKNTPAQEAIASASAILEEADCSFFLSVVTPVAMSSGVKPLNLSAVHVEPMQAANLLTSVWYGLAQFFLDHYESVVTPEVVEGLFASGAATSIGVMHVCQEQEAVEHVTRRLTPIEVDA